MNQLPSRPVTTGLGSLTLQPRFYVFEAAVLLGGAFVGSRFTPRNRKLGGSIGMLAAGLASAVFAQNLGSLE